MSSGNLQVFVRCRPLVKSELKTSSQIEVYPELQKILVRDTGSDKSTVKTFKYDKVFGPETSQAEIYSEIVAPLVEEVIQGFNCTIFAYGQTGTGKTFTIEGDRTKNLPNESDDPLAGIIPRSMKHLFNELSGQNLQSNICVSFLELYNEEIFDLLSKHDGLLKLKMYESSTQKGSVIVQGLEVITVKSMQEVYSILERGCRKRRKAVTLLNKASSRSHTIFTVTVNVKERSSTLEKVNSGKLNLVDLAGSENIERSGAINKRAQEAGNINKGLLALGRVITSLSEKAGHIPYRESKLTRLLQDSLGGQTKTAVIATISPSAIHVEESLNTLEYALRAKSITNKPELNAQVTVNCIVQDYLKKIDTLRKGIYEKGKTNGVYSLEDVRIWESAIEAKREEKFKRIERVNSLIEEDKALDATILELQRRLAEKNKQLENAKANFEAQKVQLKRKKEEHKLHEVMFVHMEHVHDCLQEKNRKILEEIKTVTVESEKRKEAVKESVEEYTKLRKTFDETKSKRKLWDSKYCQNMENYKTDVKNLNDSVDLMVTDCKNQIVEIQNKLDTRKSDCARVFQDIAKSVHDLKTITNDFQMNIDVSLREEKTAKLKCIEDFENEYSSSTETSALEQLDKIMNFCESSLLNLLAATTEWKEEATLEIEVQQNLMNEHKNKLQNAFDSTTENVKLLLNKLKSNCEELSTNVSNSLNLENSKKKMMLDKFQAIEQAISSLDNCYTEDNEKEIDRLNQAHSSMKNYLEVGNEIVEKLSEFGENCTKCIADMPADAQGHALDMLLAKREDLKTKENSAFSSYKNLTEEIQRLSTSNQNFGGIRDSVRKVLMDLDVSDKQPEVSNSVRLMADGVMEKDNSFISRMVKNSKEVEASLMKDKLNLENIAESSKQLSKTADSKVAYYQQFLTNERAEVLKRIVEKDSEESSIRNEASFSGDTTIISEKTMCAANAASELTLPDCDMKTEFPVCLKKPNEVFLPDTSSRRLLKDEAEVNAANKSSMSACSRSPVSARHRSKSSISSRKSLFSDLEKLANELLEDNWEDGLDD